MHTGRPPNALPSSTVVIPHEDSTTAVQQDIPLYRTLCKLQRTSVDGAIDRCCLSFYYFLFCRPVSAAFLQPNSLFCLQGPSLNLLLAFFLATGLNCGTPAGNINLCIDILVRSQQSGSDDVQVYPNRFSAVNALGLEMTSTIRFGVCSAFLALVASLDSAEGGLGIARILSPQRVLVSFLSKYPSVYSYL